MPGVMALPTTTPPPADTPSFSHTIGFSQTPDPAQTSGEFYQYAQEIRTIYAIWTYSNMASGLQIHWDPNLNGTRWLTSEATWDFAQCGASGTIVELVASDPLKGLPDGNYNLDLYINDQPQFTTPDLPAYRSFGILPPET